MPSGILVLAIRRALPITNCAANRPQWKIACTPYARGKGGVSRKSPCVSIEGPRDARCLDDSLLYSSRIELRIYHYCGNFILDERVREAAATREQALGPGIAGTAAASRRERGRWQCAWSRTNPQSAAQAARASVSAVTHQRHRGAPRPGSCRGVSPASS